MWAMSQAPDQVDALDAMLDIDHPTKRAAEAWANEHHADATTSSRSLWRSAADFGVQGLLVAPEHGGRGRSSIEALLTFEGLGAARLDTGIVFALASQTVTITRALSRFGTDEQRERWLDKLVTGELFGAFAMTEPASGSNIAALATTAEEQPDGSFLLRGTKSWITLGPVCDVALVFASTNPDLGQWGITAFLVDASAPGFVRGDNIDKAGLAGCPWGDLILSDVRVPATSVLGRVGAGASIFSSIVDAERFFLYAPLVGASERLIARCIDRARSRVQGDHHIGAHQAVSHRIVNMVGLHESSRLLLMKAAVLADRGENFSLAAVLGKIAATDLGPSIALDAMRTFGAAGFADEAGLATILADALGGLSFSATADIARNIAASQLKLDRAIKH